MGICCQTHDMKPTAFFMVDCYKLHGKYSLLQSEEDMLKVADATLMKCIQDFQQL